MACNGCDCEQVIKLAKGESTSITTLNYPSNYDNNLDCLWTLKAVSGVKYKITVTYINTEFNKKCTKDYITLTKTKKFKAKTKKYVSNKLCGTKGKLKSTLWETQKNTETSIKFKSNGSTTKKGAKLTILAV
jgi:RNAse (barnase) inhibitor barstar